MPNQSAGLLLFRRRGDVLEVLLAHPGGPYWRNKDNGAWTIPKGGYAAPETAEDAARREFREELGAPAQGDLLPLGEIRQKSGKRVTAFAVEGDFDVATLKSNDFELEWPPRSGATQSFPEIDRAAWLTLDAAREKIIAAQAELLDRLAALVGAG